jgi:hypothetical protein
MNYRRRLKNPQCLTEKINMRIEAPKPSIDGVNSPKIEFQGRAHQVKKLLDEMHRLNVESLAQLTDAPKFTQPIPSLMKKLDIF